MREQRLMPNGIPKYLRIYDGDTADRYTVIFTGRYKGREGCNYVGMSETPTSPLGFYQHSWHPDAIDLDRWGYAPKVGQKCHLGKRIEFQELPEECQKLIAQEYRELWNINI